MYWIPLSQQLASVSDIIIILVNYFYCTLDEGVPYNVGVVPVNLAGPGIISTVTLFTRELSK